MHKDRTQRPEHDSSQTAGAHERRVAPGKVTLASKLSPGPGGPAQRKAAASAGPASPATSSISLLAMDSLMDVAHRGLSALSQPADGATGASPAASSGGQPMPAAVQAKMDRAFGTDLSSVRIHEGPQAGAMGALAYTQGSDIHFAPGQYAPSSQRGQELLGHELAHVVQQAQGRVQATSQAKAGPGINDDAALEREADVMGARAARGEAVGGQASASGVASRDASAPVQRMIDPSKPIPTTWDEIQRYLHNTLINQRKQTFAEAVEEYIATKAQNHDQVQSKWDTLAREAVRQGKIEDAVRTIQEIIQIINTAKIAEPDHPNKPGSGPEDEQYGTIPQSEQSKTIADTLRTELLRELYGRKYNKRAKTYDRNPIQGEWKKDFMLGVLILPDGTVHVSHSGFMGPTQQAEFARIVTAHGYQAATHDDNRSYKALQKKYKDHLRDHIVMPSHHRVEDEVKPPRGGGGRGRGGGGGGRGRGGGGGGRGRKTTQVFHYDDTDTNKIEKGNPLGVCAAPQELHTVDELTSGNDFPAQLEGETPMALTEVLVRDARRDGVTVKDKDGHDHEYKGNQDVPSCLSCQVQLRQVTKLLTDRRRNVVNRQNIRERNGDDITRAVALLKEALAGGETKALLERVLGVHLVAPSLDKLEAAELAYRTALEEAAKELTQHPELVESRDEHPGKQKDVQHPQRTALLEKRIIIGGGMDPVAYSEAREKAFKEQKPFESRNGNPELESREEGVLLGRAGSHLDNLNGYRVKEYLTVEQETGYRARLTQQLEEYRDASAKLAGTGRGEDTRELNDRIERVIPTLRQTVEDLDKDLQAGSALREERRVEAEETRQKELRREAESEAMGAATSSSKRQEQRAEEEAARQDELRREAESEAESEAVGAATSSSKRQEQRAEEEALKLESLAFSIAQAYGTSLAQALRLLTKNGTEGRYTVERDESEIDLIYS